MSKRTNAPVSAGGNWRNLKAYRPTSGGLYLVRLEIDNIDLYNVARGAS